MPNPSPRRVTVLPTLAALLLAAAGCKTNTKITQGAAYPQGMARGPSLDIQVFRRATQIELTNTTAHAFGPSTIWLNARFSRDIDRFDVGQTLVLPLKEFKDEFGGNFRAGGFLAAERPERLALAEIQPKDATPHAMLGMVVVGGDE